MYASSAELHTWCQRNRNRYYVPEWLLEMWDIIVDPNITADVQVQGRHSHLIYSHRMH
jgi:hypothetical protein